jgi:hypothetical protein
MTAQSDVPQGLSPALILASLPQAYRPVFRLEYRAAADRAERDPDGWAALGELLATWRVRAAAYSRPGYADRAAAASEPSADDVPFALVDSER